MSTIETDVTWERQATIIESFGELCERFKIHDIDYDEVEKALNAMLRDDDVFLTTWNSCRKLWDEAKHEVESWMKEDYLNDKNKHV